MVVRGLTVTHVPGVAGLGIAHYGGGSLLVEDCTIRDNAFHGLVADGYSVSGLLELQRCTVRDNQRTGVFVSDMSARLVDTVLSGNDAPISGGGMALVAGYASFATAELEDCVLEHNSAGTRGGGLYVSGARAILRDTLLRDNVAGLEGGGAQVSGFFYSGARIQATDSQFLGNQATDGGAIHCRSGHIELTDSLLESNVATDDGGGAHSATTLKAVRTTFRANHAGDDGGALYVTEDVIWGTDLEDSLLEANTAGDKGGAIALLLDDPVIENDLVLVRSTLRDNVAASDGGGIWVRQEQQEDPRVFVENSTFSGNAAERGGGLFVEGVDPDGLLAVLRHVSVTQNSASTSGGGLSSCTSDGAHCVPASLALMSVGNSLVGENAAPVGRDLSGLFASLGGNLIGVREGGDGFVDGVAGDQVGELADPLDPGLAPLAELGGFAPTHALLAGSPAIDAADASAAQCLATDQRGIARPFGAGCDAGAYEHDSLSALESFGQGLAGSGGFVPELRGLGSPFPGGGFVLLLEQGLGGAAGALVLGGELAPAQPLFGGSLYASSVLAFPVLLSGTPGVGGEGEGAQGVIVPSVPALVGGVFAAQAGLFDPAAVQGVALTNAVRVTIGL